MPSPWLTGRVNSTCYHFLASRPSRGMQCMIVSQSSESHHGTRWCWPLACQLDLTWIFNEQNREQTADSACQTVLFLIWWLHFLGNIALWRSERRKLSPETPVWEEWRVRPLAWQLVNCIMYSDHQAKNEWGRSCDLSTTLCSSWDSWLRHFPRQPRNLIQCRPWNVLFVVMAGAAVLRSSHLLSRCQSYKSVARPSQCKVSVITRHSLYLSYWGQRDKWELWANTKTWLINRNLGLVHQVFGGIMTRQTISTSLQGALQILEPTGHEGKISVTCRLTNFRAGQPSEQIFWLSPFPSHCCCRL